MCLGGPAPWASLPTADLHITLDHVRAVFADPSIRHPSVLESSGVRAAAVLAVLYESDGQVFIVLTRRAQHMRSHRGEVSFAGGGQDPGEALIDTARREAFEEIGLDPSTVEIIGELDHLETVNGHSFIVPFVGLLPGVPDLVPNPSEVELILEVPIDDLLNPGIFREERWALASLNHPIYFFEIPGDTIWGATGAMLRNLLALLTGTEWR